jgi:hypothetical protein
MIKKSIRNLFFVIIFLMTGNSLQAQVSKLRSTGLSIRYEKENGQWTDWDDLTEASVLITLDFDNERITIYSKEKQVYDIAKYEGLTEDEDGDDILSLFCIDKDGKTCRINYVVLHSRNEQKQLYIYYGDYNILYNVYLLD